MPVGFYHYQYRLQVLEDWKLEIDIQQDKIKGLVKEYDGENSDFYPALVISALSFQNQTTFINEKKATVL